MRCCSVNPNKPLSITPGHPADKETLLLAPSVPDHRLLLPEPDLAGIGALQVETERLERLNLAVRSFVEDPRQRTRLPGLSGRRAHPGLLSDLRLHAHRSRLKTLASRGRALLQPAARADPPVRDCEH